MMLVENPSSNSWGLVMSTGPLCTYARLRGSVHILVRTCQNAMSVSGILL